MTPLRQQWHDDSHMPASELAEIRRLINSGRARTIRMSAKVSLAEVAEDIEDGVSPTTVLRWERGQRSPHGPAALAYLEVLRRLEQAPS